MNNKCIGKTQGNGQATPQGPSKIDQATKLINAASTAVGAGTNTFSVVSEHMVKSDQKFLTETRSHIPEKRIALISSAVAKNSLSWDEAEKRLAAIEKDEIEETTRLMQARDNSRRARAQNAKDWGKGIGWGATGTGILAGILYLIFGRKKAA